MNDDSPVLGFLRAQYAGYKWRTLGAIARRLNLTYADIILQVRGNPCAYAVRLGKHTGDLYLRAL